MVKMRRDESVTTSLRELADLEEQREQAGLGGDVEIS